MEIFRHTRVLDAISEPDVREILEWYGFPLRGSDLNLTIAELCRHYDVDVEDLLVDLAFDDEEGAYDDEEQEDWSLVD